jgi:HME family heavy-metal exporter
MLMTALSAGLALRPLLIDAGAPGKEVLHPVAITIFGGLISATSSCSCDAVGRWREKPSQ